MKRTNLMDIGSYYKTTLDNIVGEKYEEYKAIFDDYGYVMVSADNLETDVLDWDRCEFDYYDEYEFNACVCGLIPNADCYLVVLDSYRWDGECGYTIEEEKTDCFYRDYLVSIYLAEEQKDGYLTLKEYSHDVPMGSPTYIIPISKEDKEKIEEDGIKWILDKLGIATN